MRAVARGWVLFVVLGLMIGACGDDDGGAKDAGVDTLQTDSHQGTDQGTGDQGTGDQGTGDQGTGDQGTGDQGTGDQGTGDQGTGDQGTGDQGTGDQGTVDQGTADQGTVDQALAPAAPTITTPTAGDKVSGSVSVKGRALPMADLSVKILEGSTELSARTVKADGAGAFAALMSYSGADPGDTLTVEVTQTTASGTSPATRVNILHSATYALTGTISQLTGSDQGNKVFIRLYKTKEAKDLLDYVAELELPTSVGSMVPSTPWSFQVTPGTYYVRAFRDAYGARGGPDGQPTIGHGTGDTDPQTALLTVTVSAASAGHALSLAAPSQMYSGYQGFDVRTRNDDAMPEPPRAYIAGKRIVGKGVCGGFYLQATAHRRGDGNHVSAPFLRLPSGDTKTLLDDGACDDILDNRHSSFDRDEQDGYLSFGISEPKASDAGTYTFFYHHTDEDFVHIEVDELATIKRLSRRRVVTSPTGALANTDLLPQINWSPVPDAKGYDLRVYQRSGSYYEGFEGTATTYKVQKTMPDDACFEVAINAYDADSHNGDVDAESRGEGQLFCNDVDGNDTVTVKGTITNTSGTSAAIGVSVNSDRDGGKQATVVLPQGTTNYSVVVLKGTETDEGSVEAFIDADDSGDDSSPTNRKLRADRSNLDLTQNATIDITINVGLEQLAPAWWEKVSDLTPTFRWEDYRVTAGSKAPAKFVYGLFFDDGQNEGMPRAIFGLPPTATSFDLSQIPTNALDISAFASCVQNEGTFSLDNGTPKCTGATSSMQPAMTTMTSDTSYSWGMVVLLCDWDQLASAPTDFFACVGQALGQDSSLLHAWGDERWFTTP